MLENLSAPVPKIQRLRPSNPAADRRSDDEAEWSRPRHTRLEHVSDSYTAGARAKRIGSGKSSRAAGFPLTAEPLVYFARLLDLLA